MTNEREIIAKEWRDDKGILHRREVGQEIVRCRECKHGEYRKEYDDYECHASGCGLVYDADFYCADGEREGE